VSNLQISVSSSISKAFSSIGDDKAIDAGHLARTLFLSHPEYANKMAGLIKIVDTEEKHPVSEWRALAENLFNWDKIQQFSKMSSLPPQLHGRQFIIGLAILDQALRLQLEKDDAFNALAKELREPLEEVLNEHGMDLFRSYSNNPVYDSVPNQTDEPMQTINEDLLGRAAYARYLAKRIKATKFAGGAYAIHLCGPWGSGKSTLPNFLKQELQSTSEDNTSETTGHDTWIVVDFNAWRHQNISPPWWPMYHHVLNAIKKKIGFFNRLRELGWRLLAGQPLYLLILIVFFWAISGLFHLFHVGKELNVIGPAAENISSVIALLTTLGGAGIAFTRSMFVSAAKAAQSFEDYANDPMNAIRKRFGDLIGYLPANTKLAILIDDVDRCNSDYVVSLLEGIQTLYRQGDVVFVVAADKKWLHACFEERYQEFQPFVNEPGKPLGSLFLEKVFQLCAPVPALPAELKAEYWRELLQVKTVSIKEDIKAASESAREKIKTSKSDQQIDDIVNSCKDEPIHKQIALRSEAVLHLASPDVINRTEHTLKPFAAFLDDNPRSMKQLVNTYSVYRAVATLSFKNIKTDDLARWAIISMRWPILAEELKKTPTLIEEIGKNIQTESTDNNVLDSLLNDPQIVSVVEKGKFNNPLTRETISLCSSLL
jgi:hypothetical protein